MVFRNLWRRKTRTLLTILGIAIGVAAVVALSAFGEGMARGFGQSLSSSDADLTVIQEDAVIALISVLDDELGEGLKEIRGVKEVSGTLVGVLQLPQTPYFMIKGEEERSFTMAHYQIVQGVEISGRKQILLGSTAAKNYKKAVGDSFRLNEISFRVVGIYETGVSFEDNGAVLRLDDAQRALDKRNQVSYYNLKVHDPRNVDAVRDEIEARFPDLSVTRSGEPSTQSEVLDMTSSFGWFLGIFAALVGGLGMMNTTLMSVLERTREIGVLRALGWRRRRVIGLIFGESMLLAFGGGLAGLLIGIGLVWLVQLSPEVASLLTGTVSPSILLQAMTIAMILGTVGALYPAWRASRMEPVEAMRYEGGSGGNLGSKTQAISRLFPGSAWRNLWRRPTRTLVTVVGVGLGVGFVVALMAVADGFLTSYTNLLSTGTMHLMAQQASASEVTVSTVDERLVDLVSRRPEVKAVDGQVFGFSSAPGLAYFMVYGLEPNGEYAKGYRIREGRMPERAREMALGRLAANGLEKTIGDTVNLTGTSYNVVGIYENGSAYEDGGATIPLRDAQEAFGKRGQVSFMGIVLHDPSTADAVADELERLYPEIMVVKVSELGEQLQEIQITEVSINALIIITLIVGGIVMMNAMLMSVFERTQEIGVLRALGWRRRRVIGLVLVESVVLSAVSALFGVALGMGLSYLIMLEPSMGFLLEPRYSLSLLGKVVILAVVLGAVGGLYPSWRASNMRPVEALRYE